MARDPHTGAACSPAQSVLPAWTERLSAALRGNEERSSTAVIEWLRRSGREPRAGFAPAAVLAAIIAGESGPGVLLTRRRDDLLQHAGQVAFPGGVEDAADRGPEDTALREAEEEVTLPRHRVCLLGRLPRYPTTSGYLVTPVVGYVAESPHFAAQAAEVAEIFIVPLAVLLDSARWETRPLDVAGERLLLPEISWEKKRIWGATAGMLQLLLPPLREAWRAS